MKANEKRLIDANELTNVIEGIDWYHIDKMGYLVHGANSADNIPLYKAVSIFRAIKEAPTVDAVEVVHGCWYVMPDDCGWQYAKCSVCGKEYHDANSRTVDITFNYCPNCGAKMDGDGNA